MEARLDEDGDLELKRASRWVTQFCPYGERNEDGAADPCGDWCPLFDEDIHRSVTLRCAGSSVSYTILEDLRKREPEE